MSTRLLVVDDDSVVLGIITDGLKRAGYDVLGVHSVAESRSLAMKGVTFDGLVLDLGLRDGDGRSIAALWPATPVLYVSGGDEGPPASPYLAKPFRMPDLIAQLADLLERTPS